MKKIKWKNIIGWTVAALVAGFIVYSNMQEQKALQESGKRNIYALLPLTGMYASAGQEMNELVQNYMKERPDSKIQIIPIDSQSDATKAITAVQQATLNEEHPIILTSETASVNGLMPLLKERDGFMVIFGGIAYPEKFTNFQRVTYSSKDAVKPQIEYMNKKGLNDTVLLYSFNDYGNIVANEFRNEYTKSGGKILGEYSFVPSDPDIRIMILKVLRDNPSSVFISSVYCIALQNIIKELRSQGYKGTILADPLSSQPYFLKQMGDAIDGMVFLSPDYEHYQNSLSGKVIEQFKKNKDLNPSVFAISLLDTVQAIDEITKNNWEISRDTFVNKLKHINSAEFVKDGNAQYKFRLTTTKHGELVPVESEVK